MSAPPPPLLLRRPVPVPRGREVNYVAAVAYLFWLHTLCTCRSYYFSFNVQSHSSGFYHPIKNCSNPNAIWKTLDPQSSNLWCWSFYQCRTSVKLLFMYEHKQYVMLSFIKALKYVTQYQPFIKALFYLWMSGEYFSSSKSIH